jgi:hypothetical protein
MRLRGDEQVSSIALVAESEAEPAGEAPVDPVPEPAPAAPAENGRNE